MTDGPSSAGDARACRWVVLSEVRGPRLHLDLRDARAEPRPARRGVDFVGWRTWWSHRVARRQTLANLDRRLVGFARRRVQRAFGGWARRIDLPARPQVRRRRIGGAAAAVSVDRLPALLASYSGHLRHGAAWLDWERTLARYPWLPLLFARGGWDVHARWPGVARRAHRFGTCYRRLARRIPDGCLLFLPVGRYVEFYGPQRLLAERTLGLRRVFLPRAGYAFAAGFPARLAARFAERAVRAGVAVVLARVRRERSGWGGAPYAIVFPNRGAWPEGFGNVQRLRPATPKRSAGAA